VQEVERREESVKITWTTCCFYKKSWRHVASPYPHDHKTTNGPRDATLHFPSDRNETRSVTTLSDVTTPRSS